MATVTIDAMGVEEAKTMDGERIQMEDGVFVHDCSIFQDERGAWWGYRDMAILFGADRNALLRRVAEHRGFPLDLDDLNVRLDRSIEQATARLATEAAIQERMTLEAAIQNGNHPPNTGRCPKCGGLGEITKGAGRVTCPTCNGAGVV